MNFNELDLNEAVLKGIHDAGFVECTAVQALTFAETLKGRDVTVQSQTGTGKTAAFLITIYKVFSDNFSKKPKKALIIVPTRELAVQIEKEAKILGGHLPYTVGSIYGGVGYAKQEALLEKDADIIIGTPGRLLDFSRSGKLNLRERSILIIDEADRLFDMGFLPDLRQMLRKMPPPEKRMTMLFSATLDSVARELAWEHMNQPVEIAVTPDQKVVEEVFQELYHIGFHEKINLLLGVMKREAPRNALIFTNTKHDAYELSQRLECNGFPCEYLIGDLPQRKREKIIKRLKSGDIPFLVATDVAARGLHVDDLELVINYDIPQDCENYVHRIGRTARAGKTGKAVSLACEKYVYGLEAIETYIGMKIPVLWPEEALFESDKSAGMRFRLEDKEKKQFHRREREGGINTSAADSKKRRLSRTKAFTPEEKIGGEDVLLSRKKRKRRKNAERPSGKQEAAPSGNTSREERIAYYQAKYGDTFQTDKEHTQAPQEETAPEPGATSPSTGRREKKRSFIDKILSLLGNNAA
ncbi:MAG: DEAD/DEAH box helicase [Syntrophales bacterium]|nr:DEAD/DEAH box helicase [Syntrophales bacterium]MDY0043452.1 DEAD/DEAH box helicase [Syntrophales bacterium]